jgi:hypothetical protein
MSAVPRISSEAFHDVLVYRRQTTTGYVVESRSGYDSAYKSGGMVAKKTDQVRRNDQGRLLGNDEATFEKINQAVNSCHELVQTLAKSDSLPTRRVIVPALVVPTGVLWQVDYEGNGAVQTPPRPVPGAELFLNNTWTAPGLYGAMLHYRLSHTEILTIDAIKETTKRWLGKHGFFGQQPMIDAPEL